jgi:DNA-3-methyladenine glycosylase
MARDSTCRLDLPRTPTVGGNDREGVRPFAIGGDRCIFWENTRVPSWRPLPKSFYRRPAECVAQDLLGRYLERRLGGERLVLRVVEVEAYLGAEDRASHAWNGRRTARNAAMYLAGGYAYVYFVYGMHWCLNVVSGAAGSAGAVLLRAGEPIAGFDGMRRNRGLTGAPRPGQIAGGPARLCRALRVDGRFDGFPLWRGGLRLLGGEETANAEVAVGPRIGVPYAGEAASWPLRFALRGNLHVSRPPPRRGRPTSG